MMNITHIVIHCSDSPQGRGDTAATIHSWHQERGFDGNGYHKIILEDGTIEQGRPEYWKGAHVKGYNHCSIGICLIGVNSFTEEQMQALQHLVLKLKNRYPDAKILGHRDLDSSKTCPNFDVEVWAEENIT